jgi:hypothetical protein
MKIILLTILVVLTAGCHTTYHRASDASPQLYLDKDANVLMLNHEGNSFKPEACGGKERSCTAFVNSGKLVDQKSISISVFQTDNPRCCYTFDIDGYLYEMCWDIPDGKSCPPLH